MSRMVSHALHEFGRAFLVARARKELGLRMKIIPNDLF